MDAVLDVFFGPLEWLVGLPATCAEVGLDFANLAGLGGVLSGLGMFVPLALLGSTVGIIVATETAMVAVRFALWVWRLMPFT